MCTFRLTMYHHNLQDTIETYENLWGDGRFCYVRRTIQYNMETDFWVIGGHHSVPWDDGCSEVLPVH